MRKGFRKSVSNKRKSGEDQLISLSSKRRRVQESDSNFEAENKEVTEKDKEVGLAVQGYPRDAAGSEDWPDTDLLLEAAREMDKKSREDELAGTNVLFWARELLLKETMQRIDKRKKFTIWSREILK